jgi:hypothetical protein
VDKRSLKEIIKINEDRQLEKIQIAEDKASI